MWGRFGWGRKEKGGGRASNKHQTLLCDCAEPSLTLLTLFKAGDNSPVNPKKGERRKEGESSGRGKGEEGENEREGRGE